ncbi:MAG: biosynthetic-type acetolactate synthase large subunit [Oscillospiraceae bacterium]|nr:biosynthetic-type acetolactate synthase large subunit [Oscillospiraceae bacterium]
MISTTPGMMSGADAMVEGLVREGVSVVFGYPGAAVVPLYDALRGSGVTHILTRTEQGAGHAASGYARMSGRPGVCITTSGPGATNLFTAVATAYSDSIPMIAITGQVATHNLGRDVFQEVDTTGAAEPFTKYTYLIKSAQDIGRVVKEAFHICSTGRKGPVLIDLPVDVQQERTVFEFPEKVEIRGYKPSHSGNALQVKRVAEAISAARRPLLCLGGGVFLSGAEQAAREFCERANLPAVTTLMGIGAMPRDHRLYYGMLGQSGSGAANVAVSRSDLLIIIGARVGDRAIQEPASLTGAAVVHIDIDPAEIGKNVGTTIPLVGDAARVLEQLMERGVSGEWPDWIKDLDELKNEEGRRQEARQGARFGVDPARFVRDLSGRLPDDAVYVSDVGQNQIWSANNFISKGRFITTGGMGTMGYGLPAAIGAKLARPGRLVLAVMGDGAFQMSMNELATIKALGLPIKIVLMNNGTLGLVRELQAKAGLEAFAVDISGCPDYRLIAEAYGVAYERAEDADGASGAIDRMLGCEGPFLLECVVDPEVST